MAGCARRRWHHWKRIPLDLGDQVLQLLHRMTLRGDDVGLRNEGAELVRQLARARDSQESSHKAP
jgi:hypothetical protein